MLRACYYLLNPPSQLPRSSSCQYKMQLKTLDSMTCLLALLTHFLGILVHFVQIEAIFGEKPFKKNIPPLPCKECSKSFSESGSLKIHLTLIQEKSHLLLNNFPNHFHKRKSVMPFNSLKIRKIPTSFQPFLFFIIFVIVPFCLQICL